MEYYAVLKNVKISKSGSSYVPSEQNAITLKALSGTQSARGASKAI